MIKKLISKMSPFKSSPLEKLPPHDVFYSLAKALIEDSEESYFRYWLGKSLSGYEAYETMKALPSKQKNELLVYLLEAMIAIKPHFSNDGSHYLAKTLTHEEAYGHLSICYTNLLKSKLELQKEDFIILFNLMIEATSDYEEFYELPLTQFISQLEKYAAQHGVNKSLKEDIKIILSLEQFREVLDGIEKYYDNNARDGALRLEALLYHENPSKQPYHFGKRRYGQKIAQEHEKVPPQEQPFWNALFYHLNNANGAKPTKKWLDETIKFIEPIGKDKFRTYGQKLLQIAAEHPIEDETSDDYYQCQEEPYVQKVYIEKISLNLVKGLCWALGQFHDKTSLQILADLAAKCFQKIPGQGPAAAGVGNAAIYALAHSKGLGGVGHLSRLKLRIKQNNTQKLIQKYIDEKASKQGFKPAQIEEQAAPDFGLKAGIKSIKMKDYQLLLKLTSVGKTELKWIKPDGKEQKSVPSFVKESKSLSDKLKNIRAEAKQIKTASTAQRDRIDRLYTEDMSWPEEDILQYYIHHGLVSIIAKKLIWLMDTTPVIWSDKDNSWHDIKGKSVTVDKQARFKLWHPLQSDTKIVLAWRDRLEALQITQPIKQAYREVYILTEAELNTASYSNRMAAHILKQHQFNALSAIRGWKYSLLGAYDDGRDNEIASKHLPAFNLTAEFWIDELTDWDDGFNDAGIWFYVATDQVRFKNGDDQDVPLVDIPKLPFSEIMRDADLFVGVASVGNDPEWQDGGAGARENYRDYWHSYSFGDLSEVAKTRKLVLERLLPRLKIKDVAHIDGKFLIVKGKRHSYKIHIGSSNILIAPADKYLCIVPSRKKDTSVDKLFLPFEGDRGLSLVLSKAFMLADDDKITDKTILSQL